MDPAALTTTCRIASSSHLDVLAVGLFFRHAHDSRHRRRRASGVKENRPGAGNRPGRVVSSLARRALAPKVSARKRGFPVFRIAPDAPPFTEDTVRRAEEEGQGFRETARPSATGRSRTPTFWLRPSSGEDSWRRSIAAYSRSCRTRFGGPRCLRDPIRLRPRTHSSGRFAPSWPIRRPRPVRSLRG